jgi:hypothetical protein
MTDQKDCPLCKRPVDYRQRDPNRDMINVDCERCGRFKISPTAMSQLTQIQADGLSSVCRRSGTSGPLIEILSSNIESLLKSLPRFTPSEKLDNMLQLIGDGTAALGERSSCNLQRDYPLLVLSRPNSEVIFLAEELKKRGYIEYLEQAATTAQRVTMKGWERLDEIRRRGRVSTRCFVAMWFDARMNDVYDQAIEPAVREAGYDPLRIDKSEHTNRIDDEIIGQIKRSRFMVADFTGQRHGVYFEAGMMLGIGRNVIWMCRKEELTASGLHFDVRQFNFIDYESVGEAKERLYRRILAIEGDGKVASA